VKAEEIAGHCKRLADLASFAMANESISVNAMGEVTGPDLYRLEARLNQLLADAPGKGPAESVTVTGARVLPTGQIVIDVVGEPEGGS
jgi:hypothetical protein